MLYDIGVMVADIKNEYLQLPSSEKCYAICGLEIGLGHIGKDALIHQALYGQISSGADFWKNLRSCMTFFGFEPCKVDSDIWM